MRTNDGNRIMKIESDGEKCLPEFCAEKNSAETNDSLGLTSNQNWNHGKEERREKKTEKNGRGGQRERRKMETQYEDNRERK